MSSEKINTVLIAELIGKIKREYSIKDDKEVADLIGISAQNFSAKKKKGTVVNDILAWAIENNNDLNLLFKNEKIDGRRKQNLKNCYLENVACWINETLIEDVRNQNWFEVQFEKAFPEFKKWKEEKENKEKILPGTTIKKVA